MMPAIAGLLLLAASVLLFFWTLRRGVFRRYPWEQFVLLGLAAAAGFGALWSRPGVVTLLLFGLEVAALAVFTWYFSIGARFSRGEVSVKAGDPLPRIQLPDSEGRPFDSDELVGKSTALYLFYRGDW